MSADFRVPSPDHNRSPLARIADALHDGRVGRGGDKGLIPFFEDVIHYVVALLLLLGVAGFVLHQTVHDLIVIRGNDLSRSLARSHGAAGLRRGLMSPGS